MDKVQISMFWRAEARHKLKTSFLDISMNNVAGFTLDTIHWHPMGV
jgi:hypothetical protein